MELFKNDIARIRKSCVGLYYCTRDRGQYELHSPAPTLPVGIPMRRGYKWREWHTRGFIPSAATDERVTIPI